MSEFVYFIREWINFLRCTDAFVGIPLCAAGIALILTGWRLWRIAATASLGVVGALVGQVTSGADGIALSWMGGGALLLALTGAVFFSHASTILGGVVGGVVGAGLLAGLDIGAAPKLAGCLAAAAAGAAWAFANRQRVVVVLTSLEGGILVVSGFTVMLPELPWLDGFFRSMIASTPFMMMFFVLVPTVIGVTLQQADANRSSSKAVQG